MRTRQPLRGSSLLRRVWLSAGPEGLHRWLSDQGDRHFDRQLDSSVKVFERAYGWILRIIGVFVAILTVVGLAGFWKYTDWWSAVNSAKQVVTDDAVGTRSQIYEEA